MSRASRHPEVDRRVLIGNLVSGAVWLLVPTALGAWPLSLIGACYVVAASLFLAVIYARPSLTAKQMAVGWAVPWLGAVMLWAVLIGVTEFDNGAQNSPFACGPGLMIGTLCFVGWQITALAVRQFSAWRAGDTPQVVAPSE